MNDILIFLKEESSIRLVKELQSKWEGMRGSELQATLNKGEPVIDRYDPIHE